MTPLARILAGTLTALAGAAAAEQPSGAVGSGAPEDIVLEVTPGDDGALALSQDEFRLAWGGYYRFNLVCPAASTENESGIAFWAPELLENAHLRILSISDTQGGYLTVPEINVHLQGMTFRMIECEGLDHTIRFSFHPMRKGVYPFTVLDDTIDPARELAGSFIVE